MKYFKEDPEDIFAVFTFQKYEIPLQEIMLIKKHKTEGVTYALYNEEGIVYLLTQVSIMNNCICGYGTYARTYCKIEEINNYSLDTLDKDAYQWYMRIAK